MNKKLYNYSIYLLGRRDYSVKELKKKFKEKEYEESEVIEVLDYLQENEYQSDEKFARSFINSKLNSRIGLSKIKSLLIFEKGIDKELAESILETIDNNELEIIMSILNSKYRNKNLKDFKEKNKAFRFLVSKGFNFDDINKGFTQVE
jgi:regulatory protein